MISTLSLKGQANNDRTALQAIMKIKIKQQLGDITPEQFERLGCVLLLLPAAGARRAWPELPHIKELKRRWERRGDSQGDELLTHLPNAAATRLLLARLSPELTPYARLARARKLASVLLADDPKEVAVICAGFKPEQARELAEAQIAALLAAAHTMPSFKSDKRPARRLAAIRLYGLEQKADFSRTLAEAEGNNLARYLTALPANQLDPSQYLSWVTVLAKQHGWKLRYHDRKALKRKRAGAFLAVVQGKPEAEAGIVHLRYSPPRGGRKAPLALVGKGICHDSGGLNLKGARHMHGMHQDMAGSAVALGTLLALTQLKVDFPVDCWLALAENPIGPDAYRQGDVITALNGTTIEVVHTDAEGRMVLADTLTLASRAKPGLILDYATLTGSCIDALGSRYSGALTNRESLHGPIIEAGRASGERVWPFPADADYDEQLESELADIKQCRLENEADHILAGRFLARFIEGATPWVHLDLAASRNEGGLGHVPTETTGFGVRFSLKLLLDGNILPEKTTTDKK